MYNPKKSVISRKTKWHFFFLNTSKLNGLYIKGHKTNNICIEQYTKDKNTRKPNLLQSLMNLISSLYTHANIQVLLHNTNKIARRLTEWVPSVKAAFDYNLCKPVAKCVMLRFLPDVEDFKRRLVCLWFKRSQEALRQTCSYAGSSTGKGKVCSGWTHFVAGSSLCPSHSIPVYLLKFLNLNVGLQTLNISFRSTDSEKYRFWRSQMVREWHEGRECSIWRAYEMEGNPRKLGDPLLPGFSLLM